MTIYRRNSLIRKQRQTANPAWPRRDTPRPNLSTVENTTQETARTNSAIGHPQRRRARSKSVSRCISRARAVAKYQFPLLSSPKSSGGFSSCQAIKLSFATCRDRRDTIDAPITTNTTTFKCRFYIRGHLHSCIIAKEVSFASYIFSKQLSRPSLTYHLLFFSFPLVCAGLNYILSGAGGLSVWRRGWALGLAACAGTRLSGAGGLSARALSIGVSCSA